VVDIACINGLAHVIAACATHRVMRVATDRAALTRR
jgi:hypothetical protein